jgi:hypothetical protein
MFSNNYFVLNTFYRFTIGFLSLVVFTNCVTSKNGQKAEIKIISVQSQKYSGGQKGTPSGIKYKLLVIAPANQSEFNTSGFWINDKFLPAKAYHDKIGVNKTLFNMGDTITITANMVLTTNGNPNSEANISRSRPNGYNNKVLLVYQMNEKEKFVGFDQITELQQELRP